MLFGKHFNFTANRTLSADNFGFGFVVRFFGDSYSLCADLNIDSYNFIRTVFSSILNFIKNMFQIVCNIRTAIITNCSTLFLVNRFFVGIGFLIHNLYLCFFGNILPSVSMLFGKHFNFTASCTLSADYFGFGFIVKLFRYSYSLCADLNFDSYNFITGFSIMFFCTLKNVFKIVRYIFATSLTYSSSLLFINRLFVGIGFLIHNLYFCFFGYILPSVSMLRRS